MKCLIVECAQRAVNGVNMLLSGLNESLVRLEWSPLEKLLNLLLTPQEPRKNNLYSNSLFHFESVA